MLDLEKITELEALYKTSDSMIALNALQNMVEIVSTAADDKTIKNTIAWKTLSNLNIIKEKKGVNQLNS